MKYLRVNGVKRASRFWTPAELLLVSPYFMTDVTRVDGYDENAKSKPAEHRAKKKLAR